MGLTQQIMAIMPLTQETALTSAQLFEQCKGAETAEHVAKALSALFATGKVDRIKNLEGKNVYWLSNSETDKRQQASTNLPLMPATPKVEVPQFLHTSSNDLANKQINPAVKESVDDEAMMLREADLRAVHKATNRTDKTIGAGVQKDRVEISNENQDFYFAITNKGTLMLFGIAPKMIELSHEQTEILADFFNDLDLQGFITAI